jgi:formylglycine-generating enzyme required for sulfatase activity
VRADCRDGWCELPAGCFVKGSPESELGHGDRAELERPEDVKRFEIMATEVTEEAWLSVFEGLPQPSGSALARCEGSGCPVVGATWFEAAAFANALSERRDPPVPACYELTACKSTAGSGLVCDNVTPPLEDCLGYRLPTYQEFEYAVRAGTRTAFYVGDISTDSAIQANEKPEPALELSAWYGFNSGRKPHAVGTKHPNRWGLFDLHGNLEEWLGNAVSRANSEGVVLDLTTRMTKGGDARSTPVALRSAHADDYSPDTRSTSIGFRLVRTLPP